MRFRLIPREEKFFADFITLADRIVSGATLLERMLASDPPAWESALQIKQIESECDGLTHNILQPRGVRAGYCPSSRSRSGW